MTSFHSSEYKLHQTNFFLIQRIIQQDRSALAILYEKYAQAVYAMSYRSLGSVEESEEVVIDVFAKVWTAAASYKVNEARIDSWIFMMTRNRVLDQLQFRQKRGKDDQNFCTASGYRSSGILSPKYSQSN